MAASHPPLANTYGGGSARPGNTLAPFSVTVASTLDTQSLGHTYPRWSGSFQSRLT